MRAVYSDLKVLCIDAPMRRAAIASRSTADWVPDGAPTGSEQSFSRHAKRPRDTDTEVSTAEAAKRPKALKYPVIARCARLLDLHRVFRTKKWCSLDVLIMVTYTDLPTGVTWKYAYESLQEGARKNKATCEMPGAPLKYFRKVQEDGVVVKGKRCLTDRGEQVAQALLKEYTLLFINNDLGLEVSLGEGGYYVPSRVRVK